MVLCLAAQLASQQRFHTRSTNRVIEFTVEAVKGRVPVIAGTGSNSTDEAVMLTKHAKRQRQMQRF